jgi:hypothetical protein
VAYRDDREADIARADALRVEVERTERELAAARKKLAETERSRDALAAELARRPRRKTAVVDTPTLPPLPQGPRIGIANVVGVVVVGAFVWFVIASHAHDRHDAVEREVEAARQLMDRQLVAGSCMLHTIPEGAHVYGTLDGREIVIGETPMVLQMPPTSMTGTLVVRADGFAPQQVSLWHDCPPTLVLTP